MPDDVETPKDESETKHDLVQEEPVHTVAPKADPEETEEPESETSEFRNDQFVKGGQLGMSPEEVKSFGSPEVFDRMVSRFEQQQPTQQYQEPQQPLLRDYVLNDPDGYDEAIVNMNNHNNVRLGQLESMLSAMHQQQQRLQSESIGRELDLILTQMDSDLFGTGSLNEVNEPEAMNRAKVANEIARDGNLRISRGENMPSLHQLAAMARNSLFGDQLKNRALTSAAEKAHKVARQTAAVPTQQEEVPEQGVEAAITAVAEQMRQKGMTTV